MSTVSALHAACSTEQCRFALSVATCAQYLDAMDTVDQQLARLAWTSRFGRRPEPEVRPRPSRTPLGDRRRG